MSTAPTPLHKRDSAPRRTAHPVPGRRIPAGRLSAVLGRLLQPADARQLAATAPTGRLATIVGSRHALIISFRRDGRPVATPVWAASAGHRLYVRTERASGKVRRLRRDPRALVAPCTARGRPIGPPLATTARIITPTEERRAETTLASRFGLLRELFELTVDLLRIDMCYLELTPQEPTGLPS